MYDNHDQVSNLHARTPQLLHERRSSHTDTGSMNNDDSQGAYSPALSMQLGYVDERPLQRVDPNDSSLIGYAHARTSQLSATPRNTRATSVADGVGSLSSPDNTSQDHPGNEHPEGDIASPVSSNANPE
jgi:hypothetical protein